MSSNRVRVIREPRRACGFRKPGGSYVMGAGPGVGCGKLPLPLGTCPTCGVGIRPTTGFQWINPVQLFAPIQCQHDPRDVEHDARSRQPGGVYLAPLGECSACPLAFVDLRIGKRAGLLWVGTCYYPTAEDFTREADELGISKRVSTFPRDLKVGSPMFLAHRLAVPMMDGAPPVRAGIFRFFRVSSLDYVVRGDETDGELERMANRGIRCVRVVPLEDYDQGADDVSSAAPADPSTAHLR